MVIFLTQEIKILVEMDRYQIPLVLKKHIKYQQLAKDAQSNGDPVLIEIIYNTLNTTQENLQKSILKTNQL